MSALEELEFPVPRPEVLCARFAARVHPPSWPIALALACAFGSLALLAVLWSTLAGLFVFVLAEGLAYLTFIQLRKRRIAVIHDLVRDGQLRDMVLVAPNQLRPVEGEIVLRCGFERSFAVKPGDLLRVLYKPSLPAVIAFDEERRMHRGSVEWARSHKMAGEMPHRRHNGSIARV
jgi:hypothetical protein